MHPMSITSFSNKREGGDVIAHKKTVMIKITAYTSHGLLKESSGVHFLPLTHGYCSAFCNKNLYNQNQVKNNVIHATYITILFITFYNVPIPLRLARFSMAPVGSEPMERKQMSGVWGLLSSQVASRFRITPSAYLSPMVSAMYLRAWCSVRSGHHDLRTTRSKGKYSFLYW